MPTVERIENLRPNIRIAKMKQPILMMIKMMEGDKRIFIFASRSEMIFARPEKPEGVMPVGIKKVRKAKPIIKAPKATIKHWKTKITYLFLINSLMWLFYYVLAFFQSEKIYICKKKRSNIQKFDFFVDNCVE